MNEYATLVYFIYLLQMEQAHESWDNSGLTKPRALLGFYNDKWYYTVADDQSVYSFAAPGGKIYAVVASKTKEDDLDGEKYYLIDKDAMYVTSCTKYVTKEEQFVVDYILPLFPTK